jgi:tetratricopeptide (TPR) repeat protein
MQAMFLFNFHNCGPVLPDDKEPPVNCATGAPPLAERFYKQRHRHVLTLALCFLSLPPVRSSAADSDHLQRSAALVSAGDLTGAEKEARLALHDSSTAPLAWATLGVIRADQKQYAQAEQFLNTALRLKPDLASARVTLGKLYDLTGRKVLAREAFRRALGDDPGNEEARFALAQLESSSGNFDASLRLLEPIRGELLGSSDGILLLARDYAGLKQKDFLRGLVDDWNRSPGVPGDSSATFASLLLNSGLNQEALKVLETAKNRGQVSYDLALTLANLYLANSDLNAAFESYEAALSLNPGCTDCLRQLAKIATQQKDPEKALAYLIRAKREQPDNAEILFEFGKTCLELDLTDDAMSALQKAVHLRPDNDSYSYVLGSANVAKKQYATAGKLFQALLAKHRDDSVLNYAMGSLLFLEARYDEATKYLRRSVEIKPDQTAAYYYLGMIAEARGENEQATATFQDVLRRDPGYGTAWEALGRILLNQRKFPEAQQALEKAVAINPGSVKAHYQLGIVLGRTGRQADANKEFEIVQQLNAEEERRLGMHLRILTPH